MTLLPLPALLTAAVLTAAALTTLAATVVARPAGAAEPCVAADTAIGALQGTGETSPAAGTTVTVQGTVVGDYEGASPRLRGFYLQDAGDGDAASSDGVFVVNNLGNASPDSVAARQVVEVTGAVAEFQGQTQISATAIEVCGTTGRPAPADVELPLAEATALERYEGMLVRFRQRLTVTETFQLGRFGQVVVSSGGRLHQPTSLYPPGAPEATALQRANALNQLIVDDATNAQSPDPIVLGRGGEPLSASNTLRSGDTVTGAVGVLTYTWAGNAASGNAYRLQSEGALGGTARFVASNPRPTRPPAVGGSLQVASANVLNLFNTFGNGACTLGVGGAATDCRGANNAAEYERQLAKTVASIGALRADVVGLMELENDGYGPNSSLVALVNALNAEDGPGTWAFVDPDAATGTVNAAGVDAIRTALIYRPAAVTAVTGKTYADSGTTIYDRNPLAQTFRTRSGAQFTVTVNHFKSKGSCPAAGDPNADAGDGAGCWNARREQQATELARWLKDVVVPAAGDRDVLVIGDLNSYAMEPAISVLEAAGYVNLVRLHGGSRAYSYVFGAQSGYLDHSLASPSLRSQVTGVGDVHVNADEPSVLDYNTEFTRR